MPTSPPDFTILDGKPYRVNKDTEGIIDTPPQSPESTSPPLSPRTYQCDEETIDLLVKLVKKHNISTDILLDKLGKDKS